MASIVFDASAILALLRDEPGADVVAQHIGDGLISAVNFQEVVKGLLRREVPIDAALAMLDALHLDVRPHGRDDAVAAANLYPATKAFGSGLGDRRRPAGSHCGSGMGQDRNPGPETDAGAIKDAHA